MKKIILSAKDVSKSFAHEGIQQHVLEHVDLDIYEEDFTVIMGASGSGKSTLLYALSGMDRATGGSVLYKEKDIVKMKEKELARLRSREFGVVFQQMHLVSNLTLFENVAVPGYLIKEKSAVEVKERAKKLLEDVNLEGVMNHLPSQVSGGEQQRAAVARSMINQPAILFADEPTGALNRGNSKDVLDRLSALRDQGQSIVMVTHDMKAALRADRLLYLEDGRIIGELNLTPYKGREASESYDNKEEKRRETEVNAWLTSLEW